MSQLDQLNLLRCTEGSQMSSCRLEWAFSNLKISGNYVRKLLNEQITVPRGSFDLGPKKGNKYLPLYIQRVLLTAVESEMKLVNRF